MKTIYSTSDFFQITNIDDQFFFIRFLNEIKNCTIIIKDDKEIKFHEF